MTAAATTTRASTPTAEGRFQRATSSSRLQRTGTSQRRIASTTSPTPTNDRSTTATQGQSGARTASSTTTTTTTTRVTSPTSTHGWTRVGARNRPQRRIGKETQRGTVRGNHNSHGGNSRHRMKSLRAVKAPGGGHVGTHKAATLGKLPVAVGMPMGDLEMVAFEASVQNDLTAMSEAIFTPGSGISDGELNQVLKTNFNRLRPNQPLQPNQIEAIRILKDSLAGLYTGKKRFVSEAISAEQTVRQYWSMTLEKARQLEQERDSLQAKVKELEVNGNILKDSVKETMRELATADQKIKGLESEMKPLKKELENAEKAKTDDMIALEVAKVREEQMSKQSEDFHNQILAMEASRAEAIKEAVSNATSSFEKERSEMKSQNERLSKTIKSLESDLENKEKEMSKVVADSKNATDIIASKERDMTELMKSVSEMQRTNRANIEEANTAREAAETKATNLQTELIQARQDLTDMGNDVTTMKEQVEKSTQVLLTAQANIEELNSQVSTLQNELEEERDALQGQTDLRITAQQKHEEEYRERVAVAARMDAITKEHAELERQLRELNESIEKEWREKVETLEGVLKNKEGELVDAKEGIAGLEGEVESLKIALKEEKTAAEAKFATEVGKLAGEIGLWKEKFRSEEQKRQEEELVHLKSIDDLKAELRKGQTERRKMHNMIQELRGNVRVFARIRPFLPGDGSDAQPCVLPKGDTGVKIHLDGDDSKEHNFNFDKAFAPSSSQETVFEEVSEFVQSALDGYNVTLFSYGQTGSGKTHTMQGSGVGQMRGIIPRAIEQVGTYKEKLESDGWEYDMKVTFLEIYNETIRDLLRENDVSDLKHDIKVTPEGRRFVSDITMRPLEPTNPDAIEDVMQTAAKFRSVASTDMNNVSSRSHSVFTLHLTAVHPTHKQSLRGTLNLVDLAGSERLSRSGVTGDRAKEAKAINKSLSSLTDVFAAIGKKAGHIPFRNSKLTYLLQPSLCGDGKTLMIVNLSPTELSTQESLCSLRFASHVNKCELGKAKRSIEDVPSAESKKTGSSGAAAQSKSPKQQQKPNPRSATTTKVTPAKRGNPRSGDSVSTASMSSTSTSSSGPQSKTQPRTKAPRRANTDADANMDDVSVASGTSQRSGGTLGKGGRVGNGAQRKRTGGPAGSRAVKSRPLR